jgi:isoleucyl-tRNA synthetase
VKYPLVKIPQSLACRDNVSVERLSAVIWTTTPWTLPANKAIAIHSDMDYSVVEHPQHGQLLIAKSRVSDVLQACNISQNDIKIIVDSIPGTSLLGAEYANPLEEAGAKRRPMLHANFVSADAGSGLVHCAPGHGFDDYTLCAKHGIEAFAPVNSKGYFTGAAVVGTLGAVEGMDILANGSAVVLEYLDKENHVLGSYRYQHKYPYDWRTKQPIIIRATEQWFANVGEIKDAALKSLESVDFIPPSGKTRLESFIKCRNEWCISRQRAWGVPIPALYHKDTGVAILTEESVTHIMEVVADRGIDAWWTDADDEVAWIPPSLRKESGHATYRRGKDTMDVWFDSGTSWTQIKSPRKSQPLADVYLEGTDQHRGWFQSSLLTYIAHQNTSSPGTTHKAPFGKLVTHGFTLDQQGRKMSKSIGNVIAPREIMEGTLLPPIKKRSGKKKSTPDEKPTYDGLGPDVLRLWVASSDYTRDVVIGEQVLQDINNTLVKYRVTIRLLTGLLSHWDNKRIVEKDLLLDIDKIALLQLSIVKEAVLDAYQNYEFHKGEFSRLLP